MFTSPVISSPYEISFQFSSYHFAVNPGSTATPLPSAAFVRSAKVIVLGFPKLSMFNTSSIVPLRSCTLPFPAARLYLFQFDVFFVNSALRATVLLTLPPEAAT